jgi:hypothetical protein
MKIRFLVPILVLAVGTAGATTFNLPKNAPLFSIEMPDNWVTEEKGDVIVSRPEKDSNVNYSVTVIPGAKNLEDAFASIEKSVRADYQEVSVDKASQEKEAGMDFLLAAGKGKRDGVDFRIALAAFTPDGQRFFFGLSWGCDQASGKKYGSQIDSVIESIKSFKDEARKTKEEHDKATSAVPFPKDKPAFTIEIPNGFTTDATADRLIIKTRKENKSFFYLAAIPAGDGVADEATAKGWMPKKAQALLNALGEKEAESDGVEEFPRGNIAGHKAFETKYSGGDLDKLEIWVFTPDGKRYFYAYFQEKTEDYQEGVKDLEADVSPFWRFDLLKSTELAK